MKVKRGDVVPADFPYPTGGGLKRRPVLVVQSDAYNSVIRNTIVAEITSNSSRASDPAHLFIAVTGPEGYATGLLRDSVVSCINLAAIHESRLTRIIGELSAAALQRIDECLKIAMDLP